VTITNSPHTYSPCSTRTTTPSAMTHTECPPYSDF
jgi:hypothetical protein